MISPRLQIDLAALRRNYALLSARFSGRECAGVVKANAYGLGMVPVVNTLYAAGCTRFFVATLEEAITLRENVTGEYRIYVFNGITKNDIKEFHAHRITPVVNTLTQLALWKQEGKGNPAALHVDSGMCRLGLTAQETETVLANPNLLEGSGVELILSHLACAGEASHPKNHQQLARFMKVKNAFPLYDYSLCNSSGVFLPPDYHFDLARPGCALYGITPATVTDNPMENVVTLTAPLLQLREIDREESIGYGATRTVKAGSRIATLGVGYADGYPRSLSNLGYGVIGKYRMPVVGRVSMDMITVDATGVPPALLAETTEVELIGQSVPVDVVAELAGTIGYEILTGLGTRVVRRYVV